MSARDRVALASAGAALAAALGMGPLASLRAHGPMLRAQATPAAPAAPVNNAPPTAVGPAVGYFEATADLGRAGHQGLHRLRRRHPDLHAVRRRHQHVGRARRVPVRVAEDERRLPHPHPREVRRRRHRPASQDRRDHPQGPRSRLAVRGRDGAWRRPDLAAVPAGRGRADSDDQRRDHPRRRHRAEARRPPVTSWPWPSSASRWSTRSSRPDLGRRRPRRPLRLLAQPEGEGDGDVHQRPHRRAAQGRLGAVSRLHRQQPRGHGHRDRAPHGAAHVADLDPGAELDHRRQDADLQRQRQAVDVRPRVQGRR